VLPSNAQCILVDYPPGIFAFELMEGFTPPVVTGKQAFSTLLRDGVASHACFVDAVGRIRHIEWLHAPFALGGVGTQVALNFNAIT
jgi:hypothetical protein